MYIDKLLSIKTYPFPSLGAEISSASSCAGFNFSHTIVGNACLSVFCNQNIGRFQATVYNTTLITTMVRNDNNHEVTNEMRSYPVKVLHPESAFEHLCQFTVLLMSYSEMAIDCIHNFSPIGEWVFGQKLVGIAIRIVLGDEEWRVGVKGRDAKDLQYVGMPQDLPTFDTVVQSLQWQYRSTFVLGYKILSTYIRWCFLR